MGLVKHTKPIKNKAGAVIGYRKVSVNGQGKEIRKSKKKK
jgi:hypothetical protein